MTPYLKLIRISKHGWSALIYFIYFITRYAYDLLLNLPLSHRILLSVLYIVILMTMIFRYFYGSPVKYLQEYFVF
ncbi:hypothetical protein PPL_12637 [Heterostelium album PN500]|uniref:Opacity-associated protein A-like N-terminal domain-containing protein n=1 Tax=Heterostelium pallidum (strain ATCC 26659 / Pp 5 / PN500) TaxID=670386 RepID=D3BN59_HETP5|nr:hypothetical protein PPL_12637 [Heterostelium album PN500]EFA77421.1 hypothetical protein PPL_12637 [Heterostelium album PN500]|eukprot:XP_020429550.1 hypothetical protein PPL_12637 [Heterostelium album PN500]